LRRKGEIIDGDRIGGERRALDLRGMAPIDAMSCAAAAPTLQCKQQTASVRNLLVIALTLPGSDR
jgi:hypothetical protein